jgi:hypothetical protein
VSASVRWSGLNELRAALRNLPEELTAEAGHIVEGAANGAAVDIKRDYAKHRRTGDLQDGLTVTHFEKGKFSAGAIVKNTAKHAWLFDNGSQARHYITKRGKKHATGAMPPSHIFVRGAIRARRKMYEQLKALLERKGLVVTGDAR